MTVGSSDLCCSSLKHGIYVVWLRMDSNTDIVFEIISHLDAVSIVRLLSSSNRLWNARTKPNISDRIVPYQKYIKYKQWNKGLIEATKRNNIPQVVFFEQRGADNYDEGLKEAARNGNNFLINYFIALGADDWEGAVSKASANGYQELTDFFIEKSAEEELIDKYNVMYMGVVYAAIKEATKSGNIDFVKYLLSRKYKQELDFDDEDYITFRSAAAKGHKDIIDLLIEHGCQNWYSGIRGAAKGNHVDLLDFFWKKKQSKKAVHNAMLDACRKGNTDAVVWLWDKKGAKKWNEYLQQAIQGGHRDLIDRLLKMGHTLDALDHAASGGHLELVKYFYGMENGKIRLELALLAAAKKGHLDVVRYLVEKGATQIEEAVCNACMSDHREVIEYLIQQGATCWDDGLELAACFNHRGLAEFCIDKGATNLRQAFQRAACYGFKSILEMFVLKKEVTMEQAIKEVTEKYGYTKAEMYLKRRLG